MDLFGCDFFFFVGGGFFFACLLVLFYFVFPKWQELQELEKSHKIVSSFKDRISGH